MHERTWLEDPRRFDKLARLWPTDMLQLHTANIAQRDAMAQALLSAGRRHGIEVEELTPAGTKRRFRFG